MPRPWLETRESSPLEGTSGAHGRIQYTQHLPADAETFHRGNCGVSIQMGLGNTLLQFLNNVTAWFWGHLYATRISPMMMQGGISSCRVCVEALAIEPRYSCVWGTLGSIIAPPYLIPWKMFGNAARSKTNTPWYYRVIRQNGSNVYRHCSSYLPTSLRGIDGWR